MIVVLNGSPNKSGFTTKLFEEYIKDKEYKEYRAYELNILACTDCKFCDYVAGCSKRDLDQFYLDLEECTELIFVSPLYFATITSKLLDIITRFQTFYQQKFEQKIDILQIPKTTLIMTAGGNWPTMWVGPLEIMKIINLLFSVEQSEFIYASGTNEGLGEVIRKRIK